MARHISANPTAGVNLLIRVDSIQGAILQLGTVQMILQLLEIEEHKCFSVIVSQKNVGELVGEHFEATVWKEGIVVVHSSEEQERDTGTTEMMVFSTGARDELFLDQIVAHVAFLPLVAIVAANSQPAFDSVEKVVEKPHDSMTSWIGLGKKKERELGNLEK